MPITDDINTKNTSLDSNSARTNNNNKIQSFSKKKTQQMVSVGSNNTTKESSSSFLSLSSLELLAKSNKQRETMNSSSGRRMTSFGLKEFSFEEQMIKRSINISNFENNSSMQKKLEYSNLMGEEYYSRNDENKKNEESSSYEEIVLTENDTTELLKSLAVSESFK
jgi:hypothetical protein